METTTEVQELAGRVQQLEQEVVDLRQQVRDLRREKSLPANATVRWAEQEKINGSSLPIGAAARIRWADQEALSEAFNKLFASLDIQAEPIAIEQLQEMMGQAGLRKNALSRGIIEMRDE